MQQKKRHWEAKVYKEKHSKGWVLLDIQTLTNTGQADIMQIGREQKTMVVIDVQSLKWQKQKKGEYVTLEEQTLGAERGTSDHLESEWKSEHRDGIRKQGKVAPKVSRRNIWDVCAEGDCCD